MNTFVIVPVNLKGNMCKLYSIKKLHSDGTSSEMTEVDYFFEKFIATKYSDCTKEIRKILAVMMSKTGAKEKYFGFENSGQKIKTQEKVIGESNISLRLYCYRVSDKCLILFNGGEKGDDETAQTSQASNYFREQDNFSKRILQCIIEKSLIEEMSGELSVNIPNGTGLDDLII